MRDDDWYYMRTSQEVAASLQAPDAEANASVLDGSAKRLAVGACLLIKIKSMTRNTFESGLTTNEERSKGLFDEFRLEST